jgi:protein Hikeshi
MPPHVAAGVYIQFPSNPDFKFLGALANDKQSAIFKVSSPAQPTGPMAGNITLGISIEPIASVRAQLDKLRQSSSTSTAIVKAPPSTKVLAQRIIKNAFNFLASYSADVGGTEAVPLKSFQDWWKKFENKVDNDPGFLERDDQD